MILVSACLLGTRCRYNGEGKEDSKLLAFLKSRQEGFVPVCPEQLGGLTTPRPPAEIKNGRVIAKTGEDVTNAFHWGAEETLRIAELTGCTSAILKEGSPSCGSCRISDGTFSGIKIAGDGVAASLLKAHGIPVFSEENYLDLV